MRLPSYVVRHSLRSCFGTFRLRYVGFASDCFDWRKNVNKLRKLTHLMARAKMRSRPALRFAAPSQMGNLIRPPEE